MGKIHHGPDDGLIGRIHQHPRHEGAVDLDRGDRQPAQVGERGVAGAEVIEGKAHTKLPAAGDALGHLLKILQSGGFQHLQPQRRGRQVGMAGQGRADPLREARIAQLPGRHVHAHGRALACPHPGRAVVQRLLQHPIAETDDLRLMLDPAQPGLRRQQPLLGVLPAHQGFGKAQLLGGQFDHRLHEQAQLLPVDGLAHLLQPGALQQLAPFQLHVEVVHPSRTVALSGIHGLVGLAQQGVRVGIVGRHQAEADAGAHGHAERLAKQSGLGHRAEQPLTQRLQLGQASQAGKDHHEFAPPSRPTVSPGRRQRQRRSATATSSWSPTAWPWLSLTGLKLSRSR